jgi:hypothetical protein
MPDKRGSHGVDAPDGEASYALIPIRRDLVAEIDSVRDELSRSEYLRLLLRQAQEQPLATESGSRRMSTGPVRSSEADSTVEKDASDIGATAGPDPDHVEPVTGGETAAAQSTDRSTVENEHRRRSSDGGVRAPRATDAHRSNDTSHQSRDGTHEADRQSRRHAPATSDTDTGWEVEQSQPTQETAATPSERTSANATAGEQTTTEVTPSNGQGGPRRPSEVGDTRSAVDETAGDSDPDPDSSVGILSTNWHLSIGGFIMIWALAVGLYGAGDSVTTIYALAAGAAVETNPIIRAAINIHPLVMLIVKLVIIGGLFKLADNLGSKAYPAIDDQLAVLIPAILSVIGGYGTFVNLQNLSGTMIPYVLFSILFLGVAGGATVALYKGLPLEGKQLRNYQFSRPLSSVDRESNS